MSGSGTRRISTGRSAATMATRRRACARSFAVPVTRDWRDAPNSRPRALGPAHLGSSIQNRANDLVVPGPAAEVARKPVANLGLGGVGVAIEQRFRGDQHARRAEAALKRGVLEEFLLQRVQVMALRHAFYRLDRFAFRLDRQHQA